MLYSPISTDIQRFLVTRQKVVSDSFGDISVPEVVQSICEFAHDRTPQELREELDSGLEQSGFARHGILGVFQVYQMDLLDKQQVHGSLTETFMKPVQNELEKRALDVMIDHFAEQFSRNPNTKMGI